MAASRRLLCLALLANAFVACSLGPANAADSISQDLSVTGEDEDILKDLDAFQATSADDDFSNGDAAHNARRSKKKASAFDSGFDSVSRADEGADRDFKSLSEHVAASQATPFDDHSSHDEAAPITHRSKKRKPVSGFDTVSRMDLKYWPEHAAASQVTSADDHSSYDEAAPIAHRSKKRRPDSGFDSVSRMDLKYWPEHFAAFQATSADDHFSHDQAAPNARRSEKKQSAFDSGFDSVSRADEGADRDFKSLSEHVAASQATPFDDHSSHDEAAPITHRSKKKKPGSGFDSVLRMDLKYWPEHAAASQVTSADDHSSHDEAAPIAHRSKKRRPDSGFDSVSRMDLKYWPKHVAAFQGTSANDHFSHGDAAPNARQSEKKQAAYGLALEFSDTSDSDTSETSEDFRDDSSQKSYAYSSEEYYYSSEEEAPSTRTIDDTGFAYLDSRVVRERKIKHKLRKLPSPSDELLPYLTNDFAGSPMAESPAHLPRFREALSGATKKLMGGVRLYRSGVADSVATIGSPALIVFNSEDVSFLQKHGVKNIISLSTHPFAMSSKSLLESNGISWQHMPVKDYKALTLQKFEQAITSINDARKSNKATLIFCGYGDGRTGMVVAGYELWLIAEAHPYLPNGARWTFANRRNGYIRYANKLFQNTDKGSYYLNKLVDKYPTHKLEKSSQVNVVLQYANELDRRYALKCVQL